MVIKSTPINNSNTSQRRISDPIKHLWWTFLRKWLTTISLKPIKAISPSTFTYPLEVEREFKVQKTFRRRPGCVLNALCTFSLRPVSRGNSLNQGNLNKRHSFSEGNICRRCFYSHLSVFISLHVFSQYILFIQKILG